MFSGRKTTENETLHMYLDNTLNHVFINISNLELTTADSLSNTGEIIVVFSLFASLIIGSYFKSSLYLYMYDNLKDLLNSPINLLLLIQALIEHFVCTFMVTFFTVGLIFDIRFSDYFGETWCNIPFYVSVFGVGYRNFGSLGLAVLRVFFVKFPWAVKNDAFRMRMMFGTLFVCVTGTVTVVIGFGVGNGPASRQQVVWNFCTGRSEFFREVMHLYSLTTGTVTLRSDIIPKMITCLALVSIIEELVCYIVLFYHLYSHDEELMRKQRLPVNEVNKRHRKNAITFLGQFYGFVVRCIITSGMIYILHTHSDVSYRLLIMIVTWVEFGILSVVEVTTSTNLMQNLPHNRCLLKQTIYRR
jgi:hypothetical protein